MYQEDIARGFGYVLLPFALERKYPNAHREYIRQYAFPSARVVYDRETKRTYRRHIQHTEQLPGCFAVYQGGRLRIRG